MSVDLPSLLVLIYTYLSSTTCGQKFASDKCHTFLPVIVVVEVILRLNRTAPYRRTDEMKFFFNLPCA